MVVERFNVQFEEEVLVGEMDYADDDDKVGQLFFCVESRGKDEPGDHEDEVEDDVDSKFDALQGAEDDVDDEDFSCLHSDERSQRCLRQTL